MTWSDTAPDGSKSVKDNRSILQGNWTHTKTSLQVDHEFATNDANKDGLHKYISSAKLETGGVPADPTFPGSPAADGIIYMKDKTATEALSKQLTTPFFINKDGAVNHIMEFLTIRACGVFTVSGGVVTMGYMHNLSGDTVVRDSNGKFTATFATELPTNNYGFIGGCVTGSGNSARS